MYHDWSCYILPPIEISNYYLKWDGGSYGIYQKELSKLKGFIKDSLSWFDTCYDLLNKLEKSKIKEKDLKLFPQIRFSQKYKEIGIIYELYMKSDGSTLIDRIENVEIIKNNENVATIDRQQKKKDIKSIIQIKWNLGELLFNRQGIRISNRKGH